MHIHSAPLWTFLPGVSLNAHIMTVFTEQNGPSLTLLSDREPENSLCCKRLISTALPGPHFSRSVTLYTGLTVNGSHLGQFTLQYRKSLDRFMRTNSGCLVIIFHRSLSHFGMKDERGEGGMKRTRRGKLWKTLLITSRSYRQVPSSDDEVASARWVSSAERTYSACRSLLPLSPDMRGRLEKCSAYDSGWLR